VAGNPRRALQGRAATAPIGVANAGISGNRLLGDNTSGVARFLRDALSVPGVKWITVLEGINDITNATRASQSPGSLTADDLTAANRQLIETAHLYGVKVIGCTITPYGGSTVYTEQGEAIRQAPGVFVTRCFAMRNEVPAAETL
jgi:lysophospholipase L1-like esterase